MIDSPKVDLPISITSTRLWAHFPQDADLRSLLQQIRKTAIAISEELARVLTNYTDHSVSHMDGLWKVADSVIEENELSQMTQSEVFILAVCFYTHDLGMGFAITPEGAEEIKSSPQYQSIFKYLIKNMGEPQATGLSIQTATRELHAENSKKLVTEKIPGLDRFLIENSDMRAQWSSIIGDISESHNWPISVIGEKLGRQGKLPDPIGAEYDAAYIACLLRIIDFAHINHERASIIKRMLRKNYIDNTSSIHWDAQSVINGPKRKNDYLVYASSKAISDVNVWWFIYELASGLDREIAQVGEYLRSRTSSHGRFTLQGVESCSSPQSFALCVTTDGFEPVDIRFKPDSLERLVMILGGNQLYGNDKYATIRELIQNSRDAIELKRAMANENDDEYKGNIKVKVTEKAEHSLLEIEDNGIGMSQEVVTNYLLGIASDFWNSQYFAMQYQNYIKREFKPIGKFGIGFLSIFMLGEEIEVRTQKAGENSCRLALKGLGTRGAIYSSGTSVFTDTGTKIQVTVTKMPSANLNYLDTVIQSRAPMLSIPIKVDVKGRSRTILPNWWKTASQEELFNFVAKWESYAYGMGKDFDRAFEDIRMYRGMYRHGFKQYIEYNNIDIMQRWLGYQPEIISDDYRLVAIPGMDEVIICSRGIAVGKISLEGMFGIVNTKDVSLDVSRNKILNWDIGGFRDTAIKELKKEIVKSLDRLSEEGFTQKRFKFLIHAGKSYGIDILKETRLKWVAAITQDGSSVFYSPKQLIEIMRQKSTVVIGYGSTPWQIPSHAYNLYKDEIKDALLIPITDTEQPSFGSYDDKEIVVDELPNHFGLDPYEKDTNHAVFLMTIIDLLCEAWNLTREQIMKSDWSRSKRDYIFCLIKKP